MYFYLEQKKMMFCTVSRKAITSKFMSLQTIGNKRVF